MKTTASFAMGLCAVVGCGGVEPLDAQLRVAHLSPDAPAVDVCIAAHGTTDFTGPVLANAGGPLGLSYGQVTKYIDVAAAQYDVRLVAPGAADCSRGLVPDFTDLPELTSGARATIAATGNLAHGGNAAFTLRAYIDDEVTAGKTTLRFIHASPGTPAVDVGLGGGALFAPVFDNVEYGAAQTIVASPAAGVEISARVHGTTEDAIAINPATLAADAAITAIAIGEIGNAAAPLDVLLCNDSGPPHMLLTECKPVGDAPVRANIRIAHLSPDAPAVDVCLAPTGTHAWGRPVLGALGATGGLPYSKLTAYVQLPIATYDARIVAAGAPDCAQPVVADTVGIALAPELYATVAAIGDLEPASHDPGFRLKVFVDDASVDATKIKLRFVHASPGTPAVDVGVGTATTGWTKVFSNVSFGNFATNSPMNELGYIERAPLTAPVTARLAGATTDALTVHVSLAAGSLTTAFAIGNKTSQPINPLRVLLCSDNAPSVGLLTACVAAP
jgi:hypothetical protein